MLDFPNDRLFLTKDSESLLLMILLGKSNRSPGKPNRNKILHPFWITSDLDNMSFKKRWIFIFLS